ncbi:MAG TPA: CHAT domain-containing protein [Vicinamibacterales bacterium]|nr:CHAT domain-containing protein [Vicinamibacterales bacterium]
MTSPTAETGAPPPAPGPQGWTVLFYLCGHFNRADARDEFVTALEEIGRIGATPEMSAAIYLDLESGAQRVALRHGEPPESEMLGAVNSGDPGTLAQFLEWAFDACPARRYVLVMAGLGIMDADSVVGRPPFDSSRTFAICDDRATGDAIELHELSATLRDAFPEDGRRRLVMIACDMYAMQFLEVAYELRGVVDFQVGLQPDDKHHAPPLEHWPYPALLRKWQEIVAAPADRTPRWKTGADPVGLALATATVELVAESYGRDPDPVTVSAVNLYALVPLAQALDTFSVVYLQWLSNDVVWRARERVVTRHRQVLELSWSYDLDDVALATSEALTYAAGEALVRWAATAVKSMSYQALSRMLRVLGASARALAKLGGAKRYAGLADEIAVCRGHVERAIAGSAAPPNAPAPLSPDEIDRLVQRLFVSADDSDAVREPDTWREIIEAARPRFDGTHARELLDALDGIEAATQLSRLARRVSELTRGADEGRPPAIAAVWPPNRHGGLALFRPLDLDKLAESNYLHLRFSRELHWTALLTAIDLIKHHSRMLWRLLESQLTAAPLEARYQLMSRLAGSRALTGRHADQLRALSAPDALFLTIQPDDHSAAENRDDPAVSDGESIASYCVRLSSLERSASVLERKNHVTRDRLERVLAEIGRIGSDVTAAPQATLELLARCGSLLGDDILYGISDRLSEIQPTEDRSVHLVIQVPRELMRYPWELLRDRHGWLVERFAIGRQVIADADSTAKWSSTRRHGPLRLLVVAPTIEGHGAEIGHVGVLEGEHIASCFERLQMRLPGLVQPRDYRKYVGKRVTVEQFRALIRERRFDIVHFAGHGRYDSENPERSCWTFSDGPLYAFELRHTLANAQVTPWLIYGSACEGASDGGEGRGYHDGVYGMASAVLGQGVPAYIAPLWKISETDAKNLAAAFYEALLLRRTSVGEALALARASIRDGEDDLEELMTRVHKGPQEGDEARVARSAGWTGMVLYGDPTPTVMQRLSPAETRPDDDANQAADAPTNELSGTFKIIPGL